MSNRLTVLLDPGSGNFVQHTGANAARASLRFNAIQAGVGAGPGVVLVSHHALATSSIKLSGYFLCPAPGCEGFVAAGRCVPEAGISCPIHEIALLMLPGIAPGAGYACLRMRNVCILLVNKDKVGAVFTELTTIGVSIRCLTNLKKHWLWS